MSNKAFDTRDISSSFPMLWIMAALWDARLGMQIDLGIEELGIGIWKCWYLVCGFHGRGLACGYIFVPKFSLWLGRHFTSFVHLFL